MSNDLSPPTQARPDVSAGIEAMLHPRNVVLVGATDRPRAYAARIWTNLKKYGFPGAVYPVNARRAEIWGQPCYAGFADLPEPPDHVVVLVPAPAVAGVLREAAAAGARSATIVSSGFAEAHTPGGTALARDVEAAIAETGLAVTGPNCLGNLSAGARLFTNVDERRLSMNAAGGVAVVGQSGALVMHIRQALEDRGIDVQYMVTTGNESGLTTPDFMAYFAADARVRVIVAYLEGVRDTGRFRAACRAARAAGKPVIVVKLGASEGGRAAARAHTGALAGSIESFDAVAGAEGVVRVATLDDLVETTECFVHMPAPRGDRIAALTPSGGKRGLMIDAFSQQGMEFRPLGEAVGARLSNMLGPGSIVGNPLDAGFAAIINPSVYQESIKALIEDEENDIIFVDSEWPQYSQPFREANVEAVNALAGQTGKPVVYVNFFSVGFSDHARELRQKFGNVVVMQGLDRTVQAIRARLAWQALDKTRPPVVSGSSPEARAVLEEVLATAEGSALDEVASKRLLAAYGVAVPAEGLARSAGEAAALADRIGYPVVAKIVSPDILHKSDIGGVELDLGDAAAVAAAHDRILAVAARAVPGARIEGVLITRQVRAELELVLGGTLDAEMGPLVLFGSGGVDVELTRDVALAGAPLDDAEARRLIGRTRAGVRMAGYRGRPALPDEDVRRALVGLGNLMTDAAGRIASIDVNPFLLAPGGGVAVDGLIVLTDAAGAQPTTTTENGRKP